MKSYSFIKPKLKPIFSVITKIWIFLIILAVFFFVILASFISYSTFYINNNSQIEQKRYDEKFQEIEQIKFDTQKLINDRDLILGVYSSNEMLKKSLKNLLDLVPDSITINDIYLDKNELIIKGQTPTKNAFNLLMEAPLKSVFSKTTTEFYQINNGWYNFTSVNKMETSLDE
nr:hypothetical protein [Campylobacter sp.]